MFFRVAAIDDWIAHSFIGIVDRDLGSDAPSDTLFIALLHLFESGEIMFSGSITSLTGYAMPSLMSHLFLLCVVAIRFTVFDHGYAVLVKLLEVIASVASPIWTYSHQRQVLYDGILKLLFLFRGISVIKSTEESTLIFLVRKVIVQQGCLGMTDV